LNLKIKEKKRYINNFLLIRDSIKIQDYSFLFDFFIYMQKYFKGILRPLLLDDRALSHWNAKLHLPYFDKFVLGSKVKTICPP